MIQFKKSKAQMIDIDFNNQLKDISLQRIRKGLDEEPKSVRRLTEGIRRHPKWEDIKKDLLSSDLKERKLR